MRSSPRSEKKSGKVPALTLQLRALDGRGADSVRWEPPAHLVPETQAWFGSVVETYRLEEHHTRLLVHAGESWDLAQQARGAIAEHGMTYLDRWGCPHSRPEVKVLHDAMGSFRRALRELCLDVSAPGEPARAPGLTGRR